MALRLRRGTNAERQLPGFIPESGELIYTTDTKLVYVGDGVTEGGLPISSGDGGTGGAVELVLDTSPSLGGDLNLSTYNITGTGSIDIVGSIETAGSASIAGSVSAASIIAQTADFNTELSVPNVNTDTLTAQSATAISLADNLNLNNNNIVGVGNINIDGTITATGNINLGDETTDLVSITGTVSSDIVPSVANTFTLGTASSAWDHGFFSQLTVTNSADINALSIGNLYSQDSTAIYDSSQDSLRASTGVFNDVTVNNIFKSNNEPLYSELLDVLEASEFQGTLRGSIISEDSSIFFDSLNSTMSVDTAYMSEAYSSLGEITVGSTTEPTSLNVTYEGTNNILELESTVSTDTYITFQVSQGTLAAKEAVVPGDLLSGNLMEGYTGTDFVRAAGVIGQVDPDGTVSDTVVPGKLVFINRNSAGNDVLASFNSAGVFEAPILKTGSYDSNASRDTDISAPAVGSIVFVADTNELQVYNGTSWVSVNQALLDLEDVAGTAYTVSANDIGKMLTFRDTGSVVVTLPDASTASLPIGAYIDITNMDATNPLSITGTAGQVLSKATGDPSVSGFGSARAVKVSNTEWLVTGDTA